MTKLRVKLWWSCVFVRLPCDCEYQCYMYVHTYTSWQSYLKRGMKIMPRENFICTNIISVPLLYQQGSCANLKWGNHSLYNTNSNHWRVRSVTTIFEKCCTFISPVLLKNGKQLGSCTSNWLRDDKILYIVVSNDMPQ